MLKELMNASGKLHTESYQRATKAKNIQKKDIAKEVMMKIR